MQTLQIIAKRKRTEALGRAAIRSLPLEKLDTLLAPVIAAGALRTHYERITGATEYRDQMGNLLAMTIGGRHFCKTGALGDMADQLAAYMAMPGLAGAIAAMPTPIRLTDSKLWDDVPHNWKTGGAGEGASLPVVMTLPAPGQSSTEGLYIQQVGRVPRPTTSLALHLQTAGRVKRQSPPVHAHLVNPMTGQKIEGSDFTIGGDK